MKPATVIVMSVLLGLGMMAWPAAKARSASAEAARAVAFHDAVVRDAREVERLRATRPAISAGKRPQPNVYGHLADALVEAGISGQVLKEVTPGEDASIRLDGMPGDYRRQTMRVTLESVTLPQAGKFFEVWRERQPEWTIMSLQMTPVTGRDQPRPSTRGTMRPLRVALVMEATYLDLPEGNPLP